MILDQFGKTIRPKSRKHINLQANQSAGYDVLVKDCSTDNWALATSHNANSAETRQARQRLRDLSRYEFRNNPHMSGLVRRIAHEVVGTGPKLNVVPRSQSERSLRAAERVERQWYNYGQMINFAKRLHLQITERIVGGEQFTVFHPNRNYEVPVDFTIYEGDQFRSPDWWGNQQFEANDGPVDGIVLDEYGSPAQYYRLRQHPYGESSMYTFDYDILPADVVWHWYRKDRPSQYRGIVETAPALQVYSHLRRFIESKVIQEELRSKMLGVIKTGFPPDQCSTVYEDGDVDPIVTYLGDGQFTTLPDGWDATMFRMDVTGMGVQEFMRAVLSWATNAFLAPWNISQGDSSDYNFSSGRLDYLIFYHVVNIIREEMTTEFLNRFWWFWYGFAQLVGVSPTDLGTFDIKWTWDKREPIDELKQAQADKANIESGIFDEPAYAVRNGYSPREWAEQQVRYQLMKQKIRDEISAEMGMTLEQPNEETTNTEET